MVEAAGVEPASAASVIVVLHAFPQLKTSLSGRDTPLIESPGYAVIYRPLTYPPAGDLRTSSVKHAQDAYRESTPRTAYAAIA